MEEIAPSLLHGKLGRVQVADNQHQTIRQPGERLTAGAHVRSLAPVEALRAYRKGPKRTWKFTIKLARSFGSRDYVRRPSIRTSAHGTDTRGSTE